MSQQIIRFTVFGTPRTAGSKSIGRTKAGEAFVRPAGKYEKQWRSLVSDAAREAHSGELFYGPIHISARFFFSRPKSHLAIRDGKPSHPKPSAPATHTQKPDCTKMMRALEDALTGIIWKDDSQVVSQVTSKHWADVGEPDRAEVEILVQYGGGAR